MVRWRAVATSYRRRKGTTTERASVARKSKAMAAFRSAIAGNEELENLVQGFQLSEEERKEPEIILKHFMANEGTFRGE